MSEELNPKQREAAEFKAGIAAVIAVPGSGKTRTMMERIGILVTEYGIPPEHILGLTFTRNAADEMRSRLVPVLGDLSSRVRLSTIHSFCLHLLKVEGRVFEILSGKEQLVFIKNVMKRLRIKDLTVGTVLREISLAKNNIIDPEEFKALFEGDKTMTQIADIYQAYDEAKDNKMLLDFDDLLLETYYLLRENQNVREKYQGSFQSILVDEFQDTNPVQFELLRLLIREDGNPDPSSFWVAGDDHQAIYSFTGASVGNIINFQSMFPGSRQFILDLNYRSTPQILHACQNLIRHNVKQIHKDLKTDNPDGENVIVLEASNEETEALGLVNEIVDLIERKGFEYSDIAVLYRANFQSRYIEEAFLQNKIPYHIQNGQTFYDRWEVRCLLDYLRVIRYPDTDEGDEALLNILNVPVRYVSNAIKDQLKEYSRHRGFRLYRGLQSMIIMVPYVRKLIKELLAFMDPLIESAEYLEPVQVIQSIRTTFDYDRFIVDEDIPSPDDVKISNINQLQLAAARYSTISAFLEYTDSFKDETVGDDKEGVSLMTVHKAKGLEFPIVFVIGLVEGLMPSKKGNMEEERRICFVAISRAMHLLFLSYPLNYIGQPAKKSIFLDEILGNRQPAIQKSAA
ncbi:ATP-dependent helicase [uncultured Desulfosarcina sp.]|uniref:ATP-dependent helicase n=1 Tax=uncultured Desulfosarcina sp. TaxID=218289 RepID=UPI0029C94E6F|nr:ATP-dependent helicase [uncultured Desulfosarcina sp.]